MSHTVELQEIWSESLGKPKNTDGPLTTLLIWIYQHHCSVHCECLPSTKPRKAEVVSNQLLKKKRKKNTLTFIFRWKSYCIRVVGTTCLVKRNHLALVYSDREARPFCFSYSLFPYSVLPSIWGKSKHKSGSCYKYDFANLPPKIHAWCSVSAKWLEKWMGFPYVMLPGESVLGTRYKFSKLSKLNWCWSPIHFLML